MAIWCGMADTSKNLEANINRLAIGSPTDLYSSKVMSKGSSYVRLMSEVNFQNTSSDIKQDSQEEIDIYISTL